MSRTNLQRLIEINSSLHSSEVLSLDNLNNSNESGIRNLCHELEINYDAFESKFELYNELMAAQRAKLSLAILSSLKSHT